MTADEKAKILDAIIANNSPIIRHMSHVNNWACGCDPEVGWYCETCAERDAWKNLANVLKLYESESTQESRREGDNGQR